MNKHFIVAICLFEIFCVSKADAQARLRWTSTVHNDQLLRIKTITADSNANIYIGGCFSGIVSVNPKDSLSNKIAGSSNNAFVISYDSVGDYRWSLVLGGNQSDSVHRIATFEDKIFIAGSFSSDTLLIPKYADDVNGDVISDTVALFKNGPMDIFLLCYDTSGVLSWARAFGGEGYSLLGGMCIDQDNNLYLAGHYTINMELGAVSFKAQGVFDVFFAKLNSEGEVIWAKTFGQKNRELARGIAVSNSSLFITGTFEGIVDFDPEHTNKNLASAKSFPDAFIASYSAINGEYRWAIRIGGDNNEQSTGITTDRFGNCTITGSFSSPIDFNQSSESDSIVKAYSAEDIFVAQYDSLGNFRWVQTIGGLDYDLPGEVESDYHTGTVYTTGMFTKKTRYNTGDTLHYKGKYDIFLMQFDKTGIPLSAQRFGFARTEKNMGLTVQGNKVWLAGSFQDSIDLDPEHENPVLDSSRTNNIFLVNYEYPKPTTSVNEQLYRLNTLLTSASPNPFDEFIYIDVIDEANPSVGEFLLRNVTGEVICTGKLDNGKLQLFTKQLSSGTYILQITTKNSTAHHLLHKIK